jgi:hypothetical protein
MEVLVHGEHVVFPVVVVLKRELVQIQHQHTAGLIVLEQRVKHVELLLATQNIIGVKNLRIVQE